MLSYTRSFLGDVPQSISVLCYYCEAKLYNLDRWMF